MKLGLDNVRLRSKMLILYFFCVFSPIIVTNVVIFNIHEQFAYNSPESIKIHNDNANISQTEARNPTVDARRTRQFIIILILINLIIPTLFIIWITRSLSVRMGWLLRHMRKIKNQNFELVKGRVSRDEIGQLTSEFNRMTMQIKRLINDVYLADIAKKNLELQSRNAQLKALQSQINPHFLFNTLEAIRMRSLIKEEEETARIVHNMAKIFRNSLAWKKDVISVKEELELIKCFLDIQKYRFGDKQTHHIHVEKDVYDYSIPKMTFLPFVENASIHGIEHLKGTGVIDLRIEIDGDLLVFSLNDNGVGMSEQQVEDLYRFLENDEDMGDHIGIQNVIYRLKLYYVDRFEFIIESIQEQGTHIIIKIPKT